MSGFGNSMNRRKLMPEKMQIAKLTDALLASQSRVERLEEALQRLVTATDEYDRFLSNQGMHEGPNDSFTVEKEVADAMDDARLALTNDAGEGA